MGEKPWTKWWHDDFLQGVNSANLKADEIGIYTVILNLIAARGAPIENDPAWIAGQSGSSTRKCNATIRKLCDLPGKLELRRGMLGNAKMIRTIRARDERSEQARRAAMARWHGDDLELPFEDENKDRPEKREFISRKTRRKNGDKNEIKSPLKTKKSQKTAKSSMRTHDSFARARDSETQNYTQPTESSTAAREDSDDRLVDLTLKCCDAAGMTSRIAARPSLLTDSVDLVRRWRDAGISITQTVIPTIEALMRDSTEPTSSLKRFAKAIDAAALKQRSREQSTEELDPAEFEFDEEPSWLAGARKRFAQQIGDFTYRYYFSARVRFSVEGRTLRMVERDASEEAKKDLNSAKQVCQHHGAGTIIHLFIAEPKGLSFYP